MLVSKILSKFEISEPIVSKDNINLCVEILNSVMNINDDQIKLAQREFESSADLINSFWSIVSKLTIPEDIKEENIILSSHIVDTDFRGIEISNDHNISIIRKEDLGNIEENITLNTVKLLLSENLVREILQSKQITEAFVIFIIFFKNSLFVVDSSNEIWPVFSFQIPRYNNNFGARFSLSVNNNMNSSLLCGVFDLESSSWNINGRYRKDENTCYFFQQGYYSIMHESNFTPDVTGELAFITQNKGISFSEKLYRIETLTYYHELFVASHLHAISKLLQIDEEIDVEDLDTMSNIINNILDVKRKILNAAQMNYNCLNDMLKSLNHRARYINGEYSYTAGNNFNLLVCEMNASSSVTIDEYSAFCYDNKLKYSLKDKVIRVTFRRPKLESSQRNESKFVVTVFRKNSFFARNDFQTSMIVGFSMTPVTMEKRNNLYISFQKLAKLSTIDNCGYLDLVSNDNLFGLWWSKDSDQDENWIICKYRLSIEPKFYALVDGDSNFPIDLTRVLKNIRDDDLTYSCEKLDSTRGALETFIYLFESSHIALVSEILNNTELSDKGSLEDLSTILNILMNISEPILTKSHLYFNATDTIIRNLKKIGMIKHLGK